MEALHLAQKTAPENPQKSSLFDKAARTMPGIIAGAADVDPAEVLTATVAGASFGVSLGWVVVLCVPVLFSVFAVSSRIGQETKKGLVELIREQYGRKMALLIALLIVVVNMAMIVGDIVAVSDSCSLLTMSPRLFFLAIVGFTVWYVLIIGDYQKTTKVLGGLCLILIAYVLAAYRVTDSFTGLAKDVLLPHIQVNSGYMMGVVAVFGGVLNPAGIGLETTFNSRLPERRAQNAGR